MSNFFQNLEPTELLLVILLIGIPIVGLILAFKAYFSTQREGFKVYDILTNGKKAKATVISATNQHIGKPIFRTDLQEGEFVLGLKLKIKDPMFSKEVYLEKKSDPADVLNFQKGMEIEVFFHPEDPSVVVIDGRSIISK